MYSTVQAAKKLGIAMMTIHRYIRGGRIPVPKMQVIAGVRVRVWSEADIEKARKSMPKPKNGRKTRYQKRQQKTQPRAAALRNKRGAKKRK